MEAGVLGVMCWEWRVNVVKEAEKRWGWRVHLCVRNRTLVDAVPPFDWMDGAATRAGSVQVVSRTTSHGAQNSTPLKHNAPQRVVAESTLVLFSINAYGW